jgi:LPS export ABC transporter permease LptG
VVALVVGLLSLFLSEQRLSVWKQTRGLLSSEKGYTPVNGRHARSSILMGLLDRSLVRAISVNFMLAYTTLLVIFLIFTLFELLRFINGSEWGLVALYLLYLVPLATMSLAPIGLLVAVLVTYALLARRSEVVVWWASGQSLYRLAVPTLFFSLLVSMGLAVMQESVLPQANRKQEGYRAQIRGSLNRATTPTGFQWLAVPDTKRLYSYKYQEGGQMLISPVVYEFDAEGVHLKRLMMGEQGKWVNSGELELVNAEVTDFNETNKANGYQVAQLNLAENASAESFKPMLSKPSELSSKALSRYIKTLKKVRPEEVTSLYVSLYRRGADTVMPIILAIIGVPFGVFFGRRSAFWALGVALVIGLALWASASGFQQLGNYRFLPAALAAWATPLIFTALGLILFSRART